MVTFNLENLDETLDEEPSLETRISLMRSWKGHCTRISTGQQRRLREGTTSELDAKMVE